MIPASSCLVISPFDCMIYTIFMLMRINAFSTPHRQSEEVGGGCSLAKGSRNKL